MTDSTFRQTDPAKMIGYVEVTGKTVDHVWFCTVSDGSGKTLRAVYIEAGSPIAAEALAIEIHKDSSGVQGHFTASAALRGTTLNPALKVFKATPKARKTTAAQTVDGWQAVGQAVGPVFTCEITHASGQHLHSVSLVASNERQAQVFALDHYRAKMQGKDSVTVEKKIASSRVAARQWNDKAVDDYNKSSTKSNLHWVHKRIKGQQMELQQVDTITQKAYTAEFKKKGQLVGVVHVQAESRRAAALIAAERFKQTLLQDRLYNSPQDADRFIAGASMSLSEWTKKEISRYNQGYAANVKKVFGRVAQAAKDGGNRIERAIRHLEGDDLGKGLLAVLRVKFGAKTPDDKSRDRALALMAADDLIDLFLLGRDKPVNAGVMRQLFALVDRFKEMLDPSDGSNAIPVSSGQVVATGRIRQASLDMSNFAPTIQYDGSHLDPYIDPYWLGGSPPRLQLEILIAGDISGDFSKLTNEGGLIELVIDDDNKTQIRPQKTPKRKRSKRKRQP